MKNAINGGEISPTALGRTDLPAYASSCETLLNMIPMLSGGAYGRPGSFYEKSTTGAKPSRLISFVRSQSESYCAMFYENSVDIRRRVNGTAYDATVTGALPATTTVGTRMDMQYTQSVDVMYLVHPLMKPYRILRTDADTFKVVPFDTNSSGVALTGTALREAWPYLASRTDITITPSATSGNGITLTASGAFFNAGHVGSLIKLNHSGTIGCAKITAVASGTSATADVVVNFGGASASTGFYESAWSDYRGWPRTVAIYKDRLIYGGTAYNPDTLWFSKTLSYDVMSVANGSATGSDPFNKSLVSGQMNLIQWLVSGETLAIGTSAEEWLLSPLSDGNLYPDTTTAGHILTKTSDYGSAYKQAFRTGNSLYFVTSNGTDVKELTFNYQEQGYVGDAISVLYDEYPKRNAGGSPAAYAPGLGISFYDREFVSFVWDSSRSSIWACDAGGNWFGCVRDKRLGVLAWHRHRLGGGGKLVSLAVAPSDKFGHKDIWLCVERTVNSALTYTIERISGTNVDESSVYTDPVISNAKQRSFTDCSVYVGNSFPLAETYPIELVVDHLRGESVVLTAASTKGLFALPARTVALLSNGINYGVTLTEMLPNYDAEPYSFSIGYNFEKIVEPVRFDAGSQVGSAQAARKRVHDLTLRLYKTIGCSYGPDASHLQQIVFRPPSTPLNKSADYFTGDKKVSFNGSYDRDGYIYLLQDQPLPFTVCAIIAEGQTYD